MDQDGVEVEVLYSEVSEFRYIPDLKTGADEASSACGSTMHSTSSSSAGIVSVFLRF